MHKRILAPILVLLPLAAFAQTPAPAPITIEPAKGDAAAPPPTQRGSASRPGAAPPPLNIRIRDEGVKLPACTAESREGEACKK
jgi:hypothetical protein